MTDGSDDRGPGPGGPWSRLAALLLKPGDPSAGAGPAGPLSAQEARAGLVANDKERLIGFVAAPLAALIGLLIISALVADDPATGRLHVDVSLYDEVLAVLVVLSVGMLVASLLRRRLFIGMAAALYGLAVFNLHYWGFGVPFVAVGAWYLVRAYRAQRAVKEATGDGEPGPGPSGRGPVGPVARPSRRYTPPRPGR